MSGERAVLRKHELNCSSSSASGLNCMFPILGFIKQWKPITAKYPINNAGLWALPCLFALLLYIDFCIFLVQVSRHATFPIESQPRD